MAENLLVSKNNSKSENTQLFAYLLRPFEKMNVSTRLIAGFLSLSVISCIVGLFGLFYVNAIEDTVNEITDVAAPTVETSDDLIANIWQAAMIAEQISAKEDQTSIELLDTKFQELDSMFETNYLELMGLVKDESLHDELALAKDEQIKFVATSKNMFTSRIDEMDSRAQARDMLTAFDSVGAELVIALDEFALEKEAEMAEAEEEGDRLERVGAAGAQINSVLGELFDRDYPVVEAALKLQRTVFEIQDTAGEYLAENQVGNLDAISQAFAQLERSASPHIEVIKQLVDTAEDKADIAAVEALFGNWIESAVGSGKLFEKHQLMLEKMRQTNELGEELIVEAATVVEALDKVAFAADSFSDSADEHAAEVVGDALGVILVLLVTSLGISVVLVMAVVVTVVRPIKGMTQAMMQLSGGDNTTEIPALDKQDEIGEMAQAVQVFKENAIENEELQERERQQLKEREKRTEKIELLIADFDTKSSEVLKSVSSAATQMNTSAQSLSSTAEQTNRQSTIVASASEEAATNVRTVASAAEELNCSISEIGRQIDQSADIAKSAAESAEETGQTMRDLADASKRIGDVVSLITDIAEQTNLLALNATIESARAGEAGKGFAVVASEVKTLANQTAKATEDIGAQIDGVQSISVQAVQAMDKIAETIAKMNEIAVAIASSMNEQKSATEEIARNVAEASNGTAEVSANISGVNEGAEQTGRAAGELLSSAGELSAQAEVLNESVDTFLAGIRSA